ncbi:rolling circle replication-associated protein [Pararhodobacter sp.]|uniref:rolling circle replication-associated protein n=1 Tax=Pararhodobacter sp. TaxID=2127056 RepID=UPI002FE1C633
MAERTQHQHAISVTLTYDNETEENRDAAGMFCYSDVQDFLRRVRQAARRAGQASGIRFVVAGEQGDRKGRCHWHIVLYSDTDLRLLGKVSRFGRVISDPEQMMTRGKKKKRCHWTLWGKGFVTFQSAALAEMRYVAWYVVMDQYTSEKSKGTARQSTAINFATGLFRMSKRPGIGERWLVQKMEALDRKGAVLPTLNLQVPGMPGYWQPNGTWRKKLLWHLVALNQRVIWSTGAPAPQWAALYSNLAKSDAYRRILDGETQAEQYDDDDESIGWEIVRRSAPVRVDFRTDLRFKCGRAYPCRSCLDAYQDADLAEFGVERREEGSQIWEYYVRDTGEWVGRARGNAPGSQPHRYCIKRRTDPEGLGHAFPLFRPGGGSGSA